MSINVMHAKPDLRVVFSEAIIGSGSVITAVIRLYEFNLPCTQTVTS